MTDDIKRACKVLSEGGIILYPTDTVWGVGCDATNEGAVRKIYNLKKRTDKKAMLVLIDDPSKLTMYVDEIPDISRDLIAAADKPLTIIYPQGKNLAPDLLAEDGSIGIRITAEVFSCKLCQAFQKPLVSTSANIGGEEAPANFHEISDVIKNGVDYIVNYRRDDMSRAKPSNIIKLGPGGLFRIIR